MIKNKFGALPVAKNGQLLGILTETDLLRYISKVPEEPAKKIKKTGREKPVPSRPKR